LKKIEEETRENDRLSYEIRSIQEDVLRSQNGNQGDLMNLEKEIESKKKELDSKRLQLSTLENRYNDMEKEYNFKMQNMENQLNQLKNSNQTGQTGGNNQEIVALDEKKKMYWNLETKVFKNLL